MSTRTAAPTKPRKQPSQRCPSTYSLPFLLLSLLTPLLAAYISTTTPPRIPNTWPPCNLGEQCRWYHARPTVRDGTKLSTRPWDRVRYLVHRALPDVKLVAARVTVLFAKSFLQHPKVQAIVDLAQFPHSADDDGGGGDDAQQVRYVKGPRVLKRAIWDRFGLRAGAREIEVRKMGPRSVRLDVEEECAGLAVVVLGLEGVGRVWVGEEEGEEGESGEDFVVGEGEAVAVLGVDPWSERSVKMGVRLGGGWMAGVVYVEECAEVVGGVPVSSVGVTEEVEEDDDDEYDYDSDEDGGGDEDEDEDEDDDEEDLDGDGEQALLDMEDLDFLDEEEQEVLKGLMKKIEKRRNKEGNDEQDEGAVEHFEDEKEEEEGGEEEEEEEEWVGEEIWDGMWHQVGEEYMSDFGEDFVEEQDWDSDMEYEEDELDEGCGEDEDWFNPFDDEDWPNDKRKVTIAPVAQVDADQ